MILVQIPDFHSSCNAFKVQFTTKTNNLNDWSLDRRRSIKNHKSQDETCLLMSRVF